MASIDFLDVQDTEIGVICLRRRKLLSRPDVEVTEVTIDHEMLMSSYYTISEEALASAPLSRHKGEDLTVLIGGLGLGYTAAEALADKRVSKVTVIELLAPVVSWLERGLVPLAGKLQSDPRLEVIQGDVYQTLLAPPEQTYDLILIDVDHSPQERLSESSQRFYTTDGLIAVKAHLAGAGIVAIWSTEHDPEFEEALGAVFNELERVSVCWTNELIDREVEDILFIASDSL
jgi:spermidine synthase